MAILGALASTGQAKQAPVNPEDQDPLVSFKFNQQYAKPGNYTTQLVPAEEQKFQQWVKQNKVPWTDTPIADYDMRGYFQALQQGKVKQTLNKWDQRMHFPDTWKTPYDATFSNESKYALPNAPHWEKDKLVDAKGNVLVDETPAKKITPKRKVQGTFPSAFASKVKKGKKPLGKTVERKQTTIKR